MRTLKLLTIAAAILWSLFALLGMLLVWGVAEQRAPGYPSLRQIAWAVVFPLLVVLCVAAIRIVRRGREEWAVVEGAVSGLALLAFLPFVLALSGGV